MEVQFATGTTIRVNVARLNMRATANPSGQIVVVLNQGATGMVNGLPVSAGGYVWVPVTMQGQGSGWVVARYLTQSTGSTSTMTPTRTPTTAAAASATSGPSQTQGSYRVNVPILNLRTTPSMTGTILGRLTEGLTVTYLGQMQVVSGTTWYRVQTPTQTGWVAAQYLTLVTPTSSLTATRTPTATRTATIDPSILQAGETFTVQAGLLNMRSSFGTSATIIRSLPMGTTGSIVGGPMEASGYQWYRVSTPLGTGWVVGAYILRTNVMAAGLGDAPGLTVSQTAEPTIPRQRPPADTVPPEAPATSAPAEPSNAPESPTETVPAPVATETPDSAHIHGDRDADAGSRLRRRRCRGRARCLSGSGRRRR